MKRPMSFQDTANSMSPPLRWAAAIEFLSGWTLFAFVNSHGLRLLAILLGAGLSAWSLVQYLRESLNAIHSNLIPF